MGKQSVWICVNCVGLIKRLNKSSSGIGPDRPKGLRCTHSIKIRCRPMSMLHCEYPIGLYLSALFRPTTEQHYFT